MQTYSVYDFYLPVFVVLARCRGAGHIGGPLQSRAEGGATVREGAPLLLLPTKMHAAWTLAEENVVMLLVAIISNYLSTRPHLQRASVRYHLSASHPSPRNRTRQHLATIGELGIREAGATRHDCAAMCPTTHSLAKPCMSVGVSHIS